MLLRMRWALILGALSCSGLPTEPEKFPLSLQVTRLAMKDYRPCLLQRSGAVDCWTLNGIVRVTPEDGSLSLIAIRGVGGPLICGLSADSTAYCWGGENRSGEIGDGTRIPKQSPTRVASSLKFISVVPYYSEACALTAHGKGYCWGNNSLGLLGNGREGNATGSLEPAPIKTTVRFRQLEPSLGLGIDGRAYGWNGSSGFGFVYPVHYLPGHCHDYYYWLFVGQGCLVPTPVKTSLRFSSWSITASGDLYSWGDGWFGELGDGRHGSTFGPPIYAVEPVRVKGTARFTMRAGLCALDLDGQAYCWGPNGTGALGIGSYEPRTEPTPVLTAERFVDIVDSGLATCALTADDRVWCWGRDFGTLPVLAPFHSEAAPN